MIVLVHSITKQPTAFAPSEHTPHITSGPYQNVAEVREDYAAQELERVRNSGPASACGDPKCRCSRPL